MKFIDRSWSSPLTGITFALVALTGVAMFFHLELPGIKGIHEWIGLAFAAVGVIHVALNWRCFIAYFKQRQTIALLLIVLLASLGLALMSLGGPHERHGEGPGYRHGNPTEKAP